MTELTPLILVAILACVAVGFFAYVEGSQRGWQNGYNQARREARERELRRGDR